MEEEVTGGSVGAEASREDAEERLFKDALNKIDVCFDRFSARVDENSGNMIFIYSDFIGEIAHLASSLSMVYFEVFLGVVLSKLKVLRTILGERLVTPDDLIFRDIAKRIEFQRHCEWNLKFRLFLAFFRVF